MDPRERRGSPRRAIKLAAQLDLGGGQSWPCQIADFCAEGLFVRYSGDTSRHLESALQSNPPEVIVRFRSPDGRRHELYVSIVRRIEGAMGVCFTRSNPQAVDAMLKLCGASKDQQRPSLKAPTDNVQFILHQASKAVVQYIQPLMETCFPNMVEALNAAAQKALNDQQANELIDASGQMQARQRVVWHQISRNLESPMKPIPKGFPGSELSVVDKGEFEDWLTIRVMVTKADTQYRGDLLQLKLRLDKLGVANATGHHNPLGPSLICEAFHTGLSSLNLSRDVEKVCLKVFEQGVLQKLGPLYKELNEILIRQGVLPDLDLSKYLSGTEGSAQTPRRTPPTPKEPTKPESKPAVKPAPSIEAKTASRNFSQPQEAAVGTVEAPVKTRTERANRKSTSSTEWSDHAKVAQSAFATVRNLLSTLSASRVARESEQPAPFAADAKPLSNGELFKELQGLQVEPVEAAEEDVSLKDRVIERVKAGGEVKLDDTQQETLDVVDRFFRSVVESPKLSDFARERVRQLEVPVLKVVMRDPAFFDDQNSPVRAVMNRLAQLGVKGGRSNPVLQRRVDELVQRITTEFEQDIGVFEQTVHELDTLIDRQNVVYRRNVERVTAAAEGAQKVAESKKAVAEILDERLAGRQVPRAVMTLVEGGWKDLLSLTWIRQGPDSQLWLDYLAVIDSLLAYADDPDNAPNMAELLRVIQEGLASISSNQMPASQIREDLKRFLVRAPGEQPEMVDVPAAGDSARAQEAASGNEQEQLQRWVQRVQHLKVGDWLRDQEKPENPQYIRLVWIARGGSRYVFVNHQGMRVVDLDMDALAKRMRDGSIVEDAQYERPLVDESIDRMVRKVYDQLSWAATHDELTGVLGRREFERAVNQHLVNRESRQALLRIDLRHFRLLNDTAGEEAGDAVLKEIAEVFQKLAGDEVALARLAGNEFAMLVPVDTAEAKAVELVKAVESAEFEFGGKTYHLSANVGVVPEVPSMVSADRWMRACEHALTDAKHEGAGKVNMAPIDAGDEARKAQIAARVASLGNLDEERMLLRCQKIIPLHAKARMSPQYEILISMYDDVGNLISGRDFIRMAERYDQMQAVDRWVVGHMLDWVQDTAPDPRHVGGICINLSGYSLNDKSLLEFIYEKLSHKDAPIERLWFELTEASAIRDIESVADFMREIKELGCRFCLGNFGSGPVSFQFLRSLPVDMIKIDGTFTNQLNLSETDRAMVKSMVDMAHYMGREVIAAQVESREVLDILTQLGVDYAQGFAIEKPRLLESLT